MFQLQTVGTIKITIKLLELGGEREKGREGGREERREGERGRKRERERGPNILTDCRHNASKLSKTTIYALDYCTACYTVCNYVFSSVKTILEMEGILLLTCTMQSSLSFNSHCIIITQYSV